MDNLVFGWTWSIVNTARKKEKQNFKAPVFLKEKFLFRLFSARFLAEKVPVFRPFFLKMSPFEEFSTLGYPCYADFKTAWFSRLDLFLW